MGGPTESSRLDFRTVIVAGFSLSVLKVFRSLFDKCTWPSVLSGYFFWGHRRQFGGSAHWVNNHHLKTPFAVTSRRDLQRYADSRIVTAAVGQARRSVVGFRRQQRWAPLAVLHSEDVVLGLLQARCDGRNAAFTFRYHLVVSHHEVLHIRLEPVHAKPPVLVFSLNQGFSGVPS